MLVRKLLKSSPALLLLNENHAIAVNNTITDSDREISFGPIRDVLQAYDIEKKGKCILPYALALF